jgi:hypothetical protein
VARDAVAVLGVAAQVACEKAHILVTVFSRWVKGQAQGLQPGAFKLWVKLDVTGTAPRLGADTREAVDAHRQQARRRGPHREHREYGCHSLPGGVRLVTWTSYCGCHQLNRVLTHGNNVVKSANPTCERAASDEVGPKRAPVPGEHHADDEGEERRAHDHRDEEVGVVRVARLADGGRVRDVAAQVACERAKCVTGFSRWVKGQAQGMEPGGFKRWVNWI